MLPDWAQALLTSPWLPWLVCAGAMGDGLIGVGFFVYGEVFFLLTGVLLANGTGIALLPAVWISAWLGDLISFQLGRTFGKPLLYSTLGRSRKLRKQSFKAMKHIANKGEKAVFLARFLGPLSWVTPFLAGASGMRPKAFMLMSMLAVVLASAQFVIAGYLLARGIHLYDDILLFIQTHIIHVHTVPLIFFATITVSISVALIVLVFRRYK